MRYEAEYAAANSIGSPKFNVGLYDTLSGTVPVDVVDHGTRGRHFHIDLPVPEEEVGDVLKNWDRLKADFQYCIKGDRIAVA